MACLLLLRVLCLLVCVCVCKQEVPKVAAAEAASAAEVISGGAQDSEPDEPKDAEMEATVSPPLFADNYYTAGTSDCSVRDPC